MVHALVMSISLPLLFATAASCAIKDADYEQFNIGCRANDASSCPDGFVCGGDSRCRRGGDGGDCEAGGWLDQCAADYNLQVNRQVENRSVSTDNRVSVCGNGDLINRNDKDDPYTVAGAIQRDSMGGVVGYTDSRTGWSYTGAFAVGPCTGAGDWELPGGDRGNELSGNWTLKQRAP